MSLGSLKSDESPLSLLWSIAKGCTTNDLPLGTPARWEHWEGGNPLAQDAGLSQVGRKYGSGA